jgi:hypothetical protein
MNSYMSKAQLLSQIQSARTDWETALPGEETGWRTSGHGHSASLAPLIRLSLGLANHTAHRRTQPLQREPNHQKTKQARFHNV